MSAPSWNELLSDIERQQNWETARGQIQAVIENVPDYERWTMFESIIELANFQELCIDQPKEAQAFVLSLTAQLPNHKRATFLSVVLQDRSFGAMAEFQRAANLSLAGVFASTLPFDVKNKEQKTIGSLTILAEKIGEYTAIGEKYAKTLSVVFQRGPQCDYRFKGDTAVVVTEPNNAPKVYALGDPGLRGLFALKEIKEVVRSYLSDVALQGVGWEKSHAQAALKLLPVPAAV